MPDQPNHGPRASATVDLHSHSSASFDSKADVVAMLETAAAKGLSHLAVTDHGTLEGAFRGRDVAPVDGCRLIVGEEIRTTAGDVIALFLERAIPEGMSVAETLAAIHEQGGVAGLPHAFDERRPSVGVGLGEEELAALAGRIDYVEIVNGRLTDDAARVLAMAFAATHGLPGVDASDAHSLLELGRVRTALDGGADAPEALRASLQLRVGSTREAYARELAGLDVSWLTRIARRLGR
jgi:predicted metal-dependent phosphoesterase TrpH